MFLYYFRAADPCMLPVINEISAQQDNPMQDTNEKVNLLMNYVPTYPDAKIRYHTSNMKFYVDSDTAYLVLPEARSRGAGHF